MTKTIIRLPTEQFAYIEQEVECATPEEAVEAYHALASAYKGGDGLSEKDFNAFLDTYLFDGTGSSDVYAAMSKTQQEFIQTLKRSLKRIRRNEQEIDETTYGSPGRGENGDYSSMD